VLEALVRAGDADIVCADPLHLGDEPFLKSLLHGDLHPAI